MGGSKLHMNRYVVDLVCFNSVEISRERELTSFVTERTTASVIVSC